VPEKANFNLSLIDIGRPVARPPSRRSLRAVFPHRALRYCSLRSESSAISVRLASSLLPTVRLAYVVQPFLAAYVSFAGYAIPSSSSPCDGPYRLRVLWNDLTPSHPSDALLSVKASFLLRGGGRVSQVPDASLTTCHALGPQQSLQNLNITIPLAGFRLVKTLADCFAALTGLHRLEGGASPLRPTVFIVYASYLPFIPCRTPSAMQHSVQAALSPGRYRAAGWDTSRTCQ
jgi:hypothetical protein